MKAKFSWMYRVFTLASVLVFLLMSAAPVVANPPTRSEWIDSFYGTMDCGDFIADDYFDVDIEVTNYWNPDGTLNRYKLHGVISDRIVNPATGKEIFGRTEGYNFFEDVDDAPGIWKHAGLMFHVVVPGKGVVNIDAGLFFMVDGMNGEMHGKHQFNSGDLAELCAALR